MLSEKISLKGINLCLWACVICSICLVKNPVDCSKVFDHALEDSPGCTNGAKKCTLDPWVIEKKQTMIVYNDTSNRGTPLIMNNGRFERRTDCRAEDTMAYDPIDKTDKETLLLGDGTYKYIYTINGMMPGPTIVVYEGTEVEIKITNKLHQETIGIHWHGIHQRKRPWMDGVPGISHCGIHPEESFVYRFIASPPGTHWYHSHLGFQRTDGLFGALIVKPKQENPDREVTADYLMMVNDWYPGVGHHNFNSFYHAMNQYQWNPKGYDNLEVDECPIITQQEDNSEVGTIPFYSALLNGKGRERDRADQILNTENSLNLFGEVFEVRYSSKVRFRLINAGLNYALRVSIDYHRLHLLTSDGGSLEDGTDNPIAVVVVDDIIIHTGERYDFFINTKDNPEEKNNWIRVEPVFSYKNDGSADSQPMANPVGVLTYYEDSVRSLAWPTSTRQACTATRICSSLNCPFNEYRDNQYRKCMNFGDLVNPDLTSADRQDLAKDNVQERLFSLHFPDASDTQLRSAINGIRFVLPSFPPHASIQPYSDDLKFDEDCDKLCPPEPGKEPCECTHTVDISTGRMTQFVIANSILRPNDIEATAHPVHLHGHSFYVVKVGYPVYDADKKFLRSNPDLVCADELDSENNGTGTNRCYKVQWANETWKKTLGNDMNLVNPPVKDTVTVPPGGYVVIRFMADNPGWWLFHCHIELHLAEGMGFVVKEGKDSEMPASPGLLPKCGSFDKYEIKKTNDNVKDGAVTATGGNFKLMTTLVVCTILVLNI